MDQHARPRYSDFFVLETASGHWVIGREMVRLLERELDQWLRRRWATVVDLGWRLIVSGPGWARGVVSLSPRPGREVCKMEGE